MHNKFIISGVFAALSLPCAAQDFIGFSYNAQVGATSRGALGNAAGEVMTRIDGDEVAGWGLGTPGRRTIASLFYIIQDQLAQPTANTIDIKLYPESTSNPGFPDLAAGVTYATAVAGPTGTGTIVAIAKVTPPATPGTGDSVPIQGGGDVFVSFVLPAVTATSNVSIQIVIGYQPNATFTVFDVPNLTQGVATPVPAGAPGNSHGCSVLAPVTATSVVTYNGRRMHLLDVAHSTSAGRALGITAQAGATGSANPPPPGFGPAPGTGSFLSGSFPDVALTQPATRAVGDDITMEYFRTGLGTGALVVFLMDVGTPFGPETPVSLFLPGTGVACLNLLSQQTLGIGFTAADEAFLVTTIPAAVRPTIAGLPVKQQAAGLDPVTGAVHASPCSGQIF